MRRLVLSFSLLLACAKGATTDRTTSPTDNSDTAPAGQVTPSGPTGPTAMDEQSCASDADCSAEQACCASTCALLASADLNCGACGTACATVEFCSGGACTALVMASACANQQYTVVLDTDPSDRKAGETMGAALRDGCGKSIQLQTVPQSDPTVLDPKTGQPILSGRTLVLAGGSYFHQGVAYLESTVAKVYGVQSATDFTMFERGGNVIMTTLAENVNATHDYFVVEIVKEPKKNTVSIVMWGVQAPGTAAGAAFFAKELLPKRSTFDKRWYVYEWTAPETYKLIASGN